MANRVSPASGGAFGSTSFDLPGATQIGGLALLGNLVGLFAWTPIALSAIGFCAALLVLESRQATGPRVIPLSAAGSPSLTAGFISLMIAILWALVAGVLVGGLGLMPFKLAAAIAIALFVLRTLFYLSGRYLTSFGAMIAVLFSAGLAYATYECHAPPGSPETAEKEHKGCKIVVTVTDEQNQPIQFATVDCHWRGENEREPAAGDAEDRFNDFSILTNEQGIAERFMFLFNPEGKVAYLEITSGDAFLPAHYELREISPGETREVPAMLTRR